MEWIGVDPLNRDRREQLGEHVQHGLAVLQHIRHPRRCPSVVLQHVELVFVGPDQVDSDDVGVDPARRIYSLHLREIGVVLGDQRLRDSSGFEDFLTMIDVVEKSVDGSDSLLDTAATVGATRALR